MGVGVGVAFVVQAARRLALLEPLDCVEPLNVRDHDASDQENELGLLGCLTSAAGKLRDLDDLREAEAACQVLGLERISGSRRMGEKAAVR